MRSGGGGRLLLRHVSIQNRLRVAQDVVGYERFGAALELGEDVPFVDRLSEHTHNVAGKQPRQCFGTPRRAALRPAFFASTTLYCPRGRFGNRVPPSFVLFAVSASHRHRRYGDSLMQVNRNLKKAARGKRLINLQFWIS